MTGELFYIFSLAYLVFLWIQYLFFRSGISSYLRLCGHSKRYMRKSRRGFFNYWLYRQIHHEHPMGVLYGFHILYSCALLLYSVLVMSLGYLLPLQLPLTIFAIVLACLGAGSCVCSSRFQNQKEHGQRFVLLKRRQHGYGYDSSLLDGLLALLPLLCALWSLFKIFGWI